MPVLEKAKPKQQRRYQELSSKFESGHAVIPVGGHPARMLAQSCPANTESSDRQKIKSLICPIKEDHLVISNCQLKGNVVHSRAPSESKAGCSHYVDRSRQTQRDFTVINSDSFHLSSFSRSTQQQPCTLSRRSPYAWYCQLPVCYFSLDVPLSSALLWRGLKLLV